MQYAHNENWLLIKYWKPNLECVKVPAQPFSLALQLYDFTTFSRVTCISLLLSCILLDWE